jgi:hypothetical protein
MLAFPEFVERDNLKSVGLLLHIDVAYCCRRFITLVAMKA